MKLRVLGVNGPYPAPGGACSGYLLTGDDGAWPLLLDCGPGVGGRLLKHTTLEALEAVVLTHLHFDHMSDLLALRYAADLSARPRDLPVYLPDEPAAVRAMLAGGRLELRACAPLEIGPYRVTFLRANHPVKAHSIRIESGGRTLVYTGDTNVNHALFAFAGDADLLLADAGFLEADWREAAPHMSARHCAELAAAANARALLLTHLSPKYDPEALLREALPLFPNTKLARPGGLYAV